MDKKRELIYQFIEELSDDYLYEVEEALTELKEDSEHNILYHYTDEKGLAGILRTKTIRLSYFHKLNDYKELEYAIELMINNHKINDDTKNWFYDVIEKASIGVFSLSTNGNKLSQWRGYCPKEGGYAIGFDFQKLNSLLEKQGSIFNKPNFELIKCIYNKKQQLKIIDNFFTNMGKISPGKICLDDFIKQVGLAIKHPSFNEEKEWRIISRIISPQFNDTNQFKWKETEEGNQYIEIELNDNGQLPICEIKVGPCKNKQSGIKKVEEILLSCNCKIPVSESNIPFISTSKI